MKEMFPDIVVSLPEEAVGMGAKWTATEHSKSDGISIESIDTLEVTSIKDNIVTVKIKTTMSAPPQTVSNPAMPGMKLNVVRMAGKGSGNISFDPAQTMPLKGNMNLVSDGTMEMKQGGQKKTMTVKTQDIITFEAK